jgi:hypothetical protein
MSTTSSHPHIYDNQGDQLIEWHETGPRIIVLPDAMASSREPDPTPRIRIMWGQRLIDDLLKGCYHSLVCAVNAQDNSHGFITQLAATLPTSQWNDRTITEHARHFVRKDHVTVVKYDMDMVEVLALLRPAQRDHLTLDDVSHGFHLVSEMIHRRPQRRPIASVCFLGARANRLLDDHGKEPSFERVLDAMYDAGYRGDVYPSPWMWECAPTAVFARYPFPESVQRMCEGGF